MPEPTVSAGYVRGLIQLAAAKGASREALTQRSGIALEELLDQDNRIPFANYVALMKAGQDLCNEPALALHYGEAIDFSEISIVGLICNASETMLDAFVQTNRYGRLVIEVDGMHTRDRFELVHNDGGLWLVDHRTNPNDFPELTESTFARMACGPRRFSETLSVGAVHVTHARPAHHAEYDRIFQAPIVFDSDKNALLLDKSWMTHRVALQPRYVFGVLTQHADGLIEELESSKSTRGRVEALLMPVLHTGDANMDAMAGKLGLSRQTLYRRLKDEGVTFEKVLDELRHKMALHYLNGKNVSVNETAYLVGFSDPSAFSRAFKRWTGKSPRAARSPKP